MPYYCESKSVVNYGNNTRIYNKYLLNRYFIGFTAIYCPNTLLFECEGLGSRVLPYYCESQSVVNYGNNTRIYNKYLLNSILRQYIALTIHGFPALGTGTAGTAAAGAWSALSAVTQRASSSESSGRGALQCSSSSGGRSTSRERLVGAVRLAAFRKRGFVASSIALTCPGRDPPRVTLLIKAQTRIRSMNNFFARLRALTCGI